MKKARIGEVGVGGLGADLRIFLGGRARIGFQRKEGRKNKQKRIRWNCPRRLDSWMVFAEKHIRTRKG